MKKNYYVYPAFITACIAFSLAIFPYPNSWHIGTSLPMKIVILIVALLSDYYVTKSKQVNNLVRLNKGILFKPKLLKVASILATLTTVVALFSIFYI